MAATVFVLTQKEISFPQDSIYVPLQVGAATGQDLGYIRDDNGGDQISELHCFFGYLTGIYWIWKNYTGQENIGICPEHLWAEEVSGEKLDDLLGRCDVLIAKPVESDVTFGQRFSEEHHANDLEAVQASLAKLYPEDEWAFEDVLNGKRQYAGHGCVMKRALFDDCCNWLFTILMDAGQRIDASHYESDEMCVYAYLAEALFPTWLLARGLRVCEVLESEKKASGADLLSLLRQLLQQHKTKEAYEYIHKAMTDHPEATLPVSDEGNNLVIAEQVLYLKYLDEEDGHDSMWKQEWDLDTLTDHYRNIYSMMQLVSTGEELGEYEVEYLKQSGFNAMTADLMVRNDPAERLQKPYLKGDEIVSYLAKYNLF
ncbi:protein of unknown function [Lachnospiraceae bacterium KHCPX20]|nr:protein of unknown function [Lachnospiraceae bacterium KHCPX20]